MKWFKMGTEVETTHEDKPYSPKSLEELVDVIRRAPEDVLNQQQKKMLGRAMSFESRQVQEVMLPRERIVMVEGGEFLGPLTLDRLYKSGFEHFPVIDENERIIGILKTEQLNNLNEREGRPAREYVDTKVVYVEEDDSLPKAVKKLLDGDATYAIVQDKSKRPVGALTMQMCWQAISVPEIFD